MTAPDPLAALPLTVEEEAELRRAVDNDLRRGVRERWMNTDTIAHLLDTLDAARAPQDGAKCCVRERPDSQPCDLPAGHAPAPALREALERISAEVDANDQRTRHSESCPTAFRVFRGIVQRELDALAPAAPADTSRERVYGNGETFAADAAPANTGRVFTEKQTFALAIGYYAGRSIGSDKGRGKMLGDLDDNDSQRAAFDEGYEWGVADFCRYDAPDSAKE